MKILIAIILGLVIFAGAGPIFAHAEQPGFTNAASISTTGDSELPHVFVSGDGVFAVWTQTSLGKSDVLFAKSTDGGYTFGTPVNVSGSSKGQSLYPQFVEKDNHVYVTWIEKSGDNSTNVIFAKSDDSGNSFGTPLHVTHNMGNSGIPKLYSD